MKQRAFRRRRLSVEQVAERSSAARCARDLALPSIRRSDVLRYWHAIEWQFAVRRWRFALPRQAAVRRQIWSAEE